MKVIMKRTEHDKSIFKNTKNSSGSHLTSGFSSRMSGSPSYRRGDGGSKGQAEGRKGGRRGQRGCVATPESGGPGEGPKTEGLF